MRILLLHPPEHHPSGGHVYNRNLLRAARRQGFPLEAQTVSAGRRNSPALAPDTIVLWDSLLLESLAQRPVAANGAVHGLLVHYLPFRDPGLSTTARLLRKTRFDLAMARVRFLIATGREVAGFLQHRYPSRRVGLCEPGVDPLFLSARGMATPKRDDLVHLVTVAPLIPAKAHEELISALQGLEDSPWIWHWVGSPGVAPRYAARLYARIQELGWEERIVCHGTLNTPTLARLLAHMDVFVSASRFESYGMALAEAAAVGVPTVATAVGEACRIVRPGETGWLVAPGAIAALREALRTLIEDPALRARFRARLLKESPRTWQETLDDFRRSLASLSPQFSRAR
jgi:glycosyltransferase involved in cell wall biosynthesis